MDVEEWFLPVNRMFPSTEAIYVFSYIVANYIFSRKYVKYLYITWASVWSLFIWIMLAWVSKCCIKLNRSGFSTMELYVDEPGNAVNFVMVN